MITETTADHLSWLREFAAWDEPHDDEQREEAARRLDALVASVRRDALSEAADALAFGARATIERIRDSPPSLAPLDVVHMGRERYGAAGGHNGAP
jgi:hypothetical protein